MTKKNILVYVVGGAVGYARFLNNVTITDDLESANIVLFTGGEDVDPSLYGRKKHPTTGSNIQRDRKEQEIYKKVKPNQLCVGICRGSQFLCVMNGGILVQNCDNHALWETHPICSHTGDDMMYEITSTHHQMQYPFCINSDNYELLYTARGRSSYYEGDGVNPDLPRVIGEPEIVLYHCPKKPKCLAIQGHPEMLPATSPVVEMLNKLISDILSGNLPTSRIRGGLTIPSFGTSIRMKAAHLPVLDPIVNELIRNL